jgi:hypothetical protein
MSIRRKITPQQFFKSAGYNLWLVNDKKQPIKTTPTGIRVAIKEWSMIIDFEQFYPSITAIAYLGFCLCFQPPLSIKRDSV